MNNTKLKYTVANVKNIFCILLAMVGELCIINIIITMRIEYKSIKTFYPGNDSFLFLLNIPLLLIYMIIYLKKIKSGIYTNNNRIYSNIDKEHDTIFNNKGYDRQNNKRIKLTLLFMACIGCFTIGIYDMLYPVISLCLPNLFYQINIGCLIGLIACFKLFIVCFQRIYIVAK